MARWRRASTPDQNAPHASRSDSGRADGASPSRSPTPLSRVRLLHHPAFEDPPPERKPRGRTVTEVTWSVPVMCSLAPASTSTVDFLDRPLEKTSTPAKTLA